MPHADFNRIAAHTERSSCPIHIIALVLPVHQLAQKVVAVNMLADADRKEHVAVLVWIGGCINAGDRGDDDRVAPFQHGVDRGHPKHVQLIVGHRVLFNISIGLRHVGFRLIVIKIGYEIFHAVMRKQFLEFGIQLTGQRLVVGKNQRRTIHPFDHIADRKRLAGTCGPQQYLFLFAFL